MPQSQLRFGWREWAALPQLKVRRLRVKVDTGARTSTLHAYPIELIERNNLPWVRFGLHLSRKDPEKTHWCEAPVLDHRVIKNSNGYSEERVVVATTVCIGNLCWPIAVTLTNRSTMKYRMLLGRTGLPSDACVIPHVSWLQGDPNLGKPTVHEFVET